MDNIKRVRCPNPQCRQINIIDIEKELMRQGNNVIIRTTTPISPDTKLPGSIVVVCSNPACRRQFKVKL